MEIKTSRSWLQLIVESNRKGKGSIIKRWI